MKLLVIRCLLRCYPRAWRRRYGEEFAALLEQTPLNATQLLDALRSALDARWRRGREWADRFGGVLLEEDERRFWWRWVTILATAGAAVAAICWLVPYGLMWASVDDSNSTHFNWMVAFFSLPFLGMVAVGLGFAEWRTIRAILPTLSRWWIIASLIGPVAALMIISPSRDYRTVPDLWSMSHYMLNYLNTLSFPIVVPPGLQNILAFSLPSLYFAGIVAAVQCYVLKGAITRPSWWIVIAILAGNAGQVTARLFTLLRPAHYYNELIPKVARTEIFAWDGVAFLHTVDNVDTVLKVKP